MNCTVEASGNVHDNNLDLLSSNPLRSEIQIVFFLYLLSSGWFEVIFILYNNCPGSADWSLSKYLVSIYLHSINNIFTLQPHTPHQTGHTYSYHNRLDILHLKELDFSLYNIGVCVCTCCFYLYSQFESDLSNKF